MFRQDFTCPALLWILLANLKISSTGLSPSTVCFSKTLWLSKIVLYMQSEPLTRRQGLACIRFARRYWGYRVFFLFLLLLRCFSSQRIPPYSYVFTVWRLRFTQPGFPIRTSTDHSLFAASRSFSQLTASFIGCRCQGIHPLLFIACSFSQPF